MARNDSASRWRADRVVRPYEIARKCVQRGGQSRPSPQIFKRDVGDAVPYGVQRIYGADNATVRNQLDGGA